VRKIYALFFFVILVHSAHALRFDFEKINEKSKDYIVIVNTKIEVSFGTQSSEVQSKTIGAIVSKDGLVLFDGRDIDSDNPYSIMSGMMISTEPKSIEITLLDGKKYPAEYIGLDKFTRLAFCRINSEEKKEFKFAAFKKRDDFKIGDWVSAFLLLPEFVTPRLGADIGMISAIIEEPEKFVFAVGFSELELGSVLFDTSGIAVGILGELENPAFAGLESSNMPSMSESESMVSMLGIIGAEKIEKLIKNPPVKGEVTRGWLGIYLQALTSDIAEFWGLKEGGGIIINEIINDSPADLAGLKTGDIIIKLNGKPVDVDKEENLPIFQKEISESGAEAEVNFDILRRVEGKVDTLNITATLTKAPLTPAEAPDYEDKNFEMKVRDMVFVDYNLYKLDKRDFKGVVIKEVEPGGWAAVGEMEPGDIIQSIGSDKIGSIEDAKMVFRKLSEQKPKEVVFFLWRDSKTLFKNVKTDW
jgi:serine protease Do